MICLHACPACERHVRSNETSCPFCDASLPGRCTAPDAHPIGRVPSRSAITFFAAAAIVACGKQSRPEDQPVAVYGPAPIDTSQPDAAAVPTEPIPPPTVATPDASTKDGAK